MIRRTSRHPWRRLLAFLIDWLCILAWVAVVAAVGIPLYLAGVTRGLTLIELNLVATAALVVPATLALAWLESGRAEASPGKRTRSLIVVSARTGSRIPFAQALARNALKIGLPWTIGHAAVFAIVAASETTAAGTATGSPGVAVWVLTAIAYLLPLACVVSLFVGDGRTPYDRVCGTAVRLRPPAARTATPVR